MTDQDQERLATETAPGQALRLLSRQLGTPHIIIKRAYLVDLSVERRAKNGNRQDGAERFVQQWERHEAHVQIDLTELMYIMAYKAMLNVNRMSVEARGAVRCRLDRAPFTPLTNLGVIVEHTNDE